MSMSDLQRKIQQAGDRKNRSRPSSRSNSRPSSKPGSRSSSRVGSRAPSDDEDEYTQLNFLHHADALTDSLEDLTVDRGDEEEGFRTKDRFSESIQALEEDRRSSPLDVRERALLVILSVITAKYEPQLLTEHLCNVMLRVFKNAKSELESMLALQAICVMAASEDSEVAVEHVSALTTKILASIDNTSLEANTRAHMILGYAMLQFFTLYGSGAFKAEEIVEKLLEIAESDGDSAVASAAILGAGLLATTVHKPNSIVEQMMPSLIEMLAQPSQEVKLAAGKVIGLFVQNYQYEEDMDEIPFVDYYELTTKLQEIVTMSSKKVSKKDKREQRSLFRDVLKTVNIFSNHKSRQNLNQEDLVITHLKLARAKSLAVDSWNKLLLVQMYRWLFGQGIHTMAANNPFVRDTINDASFDVSSEFNDSSDYVALSAGTDESDVPRRKHEINELERTKFLRARRMEKQQAHSLEV